MVECKICKETFDDLRSLTRHLKNDHKIDQKSYYDEYLKTENEGICKNCGRETKFRRFDQGYRKYCCSECQRIGGVRAWRKTMNEKYDGGYFIGSPEGRKIMRERCLEHYGTEYIWQAKEIKKKRSETMLKNHGVEHTMQNPELKKIAKEHREATNLKRYGVKHNWSSKALREIGQYKTCKEKYGVSIPAKDPRFHRGFKHGKYKAPNGNSYDSRWEYLYEQYLIESNVNYIYQSDRTLKWHDIYGIEHTYIPDFHIIDTDKLIEIKGDHYFDSDGNFINPYDKSEEAAANAKLKWKCMMDAGVIVLTSKELLELGINVRK